MTARAAIAAAPVVLAVRVRMVPRLMAATSLPPLAPVLVAFARHPLVPKRKENKHVAT